MFTLKKNNLKQLFRMAFLSVCMLFAFTYNVEAAGKIKLNISKATLATDQGILLELKGYSGAVKWSSSNTKAATVNKYGLILARRKGNTVITAKAGKKKYKCKIMVKALKVKSLKLNEKTLTLKKGGKATLKATASPANASNKGVTWKSSNKKVATVNSKGVVTAKKNGTATITATTKDGSRKKAVCKISVQSKVSKTLSIDYSTDIRKQAPYADPALWNAFERLGFQLSFDSKLDCNGIFRPGKQSIILKYPGPTIYHELGHFLAFLAVSADYSDEWNRIYKEEKRYVTCSNRDYVAKDAQEYFAESYSDFVLNKLSLQKSRPKTAAYIQQCLDEIRSNTDIYWQDMRSSYRKELDWN